MFPWLFPFRKSITNHRGQFCDTHKCTNIFLKKIADFIKKLRTSRQTQLKKQKKAFLQKKKSQSTLKTKYPLQFKKQINLKK